MKVKSKPDVTEPCRYETLPFKEAEEQDKEGHNDKTPAREISGLRWKKTMEDDISKENSFDVEGLLSTPTLLGESDDPKHLSLAKVLAEDDGEKDGAWKLPPSEQITQQTLAKLRGKGMPDRCKLSQVELEVEIRSGTLKRSDAKILIEVLAKRRANLETIKSGDRARLDNGLATSWQLEETLKSLRLTKDGHRSIMEDNRQLILQYNGHGEMRCIDMKDALKEKRISEDQYNQENEVYGVRNSEYLEVNRHFRD